MLAAEEAGGLRPARFGNFRLAAPEDRRPPGTGSRARFEGGDRGAGRVRGKVPRQAERRRTRESRETGTGG